jgi:hypothetical protein
MLLPFVQLDFPGLLGLPEGRYLSRDDVGERVLIVQTAGAPAPPGRLRRRARPVEPGAPEQVPLTRVTVTGAEALPDQGAASRWLQETAGDSGGRSREVRAAVLLLNRALAALRAGARDPLVQETGATRALGVRIGYGDGDELAEGRWTEARELPPPRRGRLDDIDPQTKVAAVLSGRERVHPAETLLERARLDIEQGRGIEARLGLRAARTALSEDPDGDPDALAARIEEAEGKLDGGP